VRAIRRSIGPSDGVWQDEDGRSEHGGDLRRPDSPEPGGRIGHPRRYHARPPGCARKPSWQYRPESYRPKRASTMKVHSGACWNVRALTRVKSRCRSKGTRSASWCGTGGSAIQGEIPPAPMWWPHFRLLWALGCLPRLLPRWHLSVAAGASRSIGRLCPTASLGG
jgi:hypothetical protein